MQILESFNFYTESKNIQRYCLEKLLPRVNWKLKVVLNPFTSFSSERYYLQKILYIRFTLTAYFHFPSPRHSRVELKKIIFLYFFPFHFVLWYLERTFSFTSSSNTRQSKKKRKSALNKFCSDCCQKGFIQKLHKANLLNITILKPPDTHAYVCVSVGYNILMFKSLTLRNF